MVQSLFEVLFKKQRQGRAKIHGRARSSRRRCALWHARATRASAGLMCPPVPGEDAGFPRAHPGFLAGPAAGIALFGLLFAPACRTPEVLDIPQRAPIPVDASHIPTVALITYAGHVDPARVSDGTFCPHADRVLFDLFFSVPEVILEQELRRAGYPVTEVPAPLAAELAAPYATHVAVMFVGDSRCELRVPLFGPRQAEDCSVRVRVVITSTAADKPRRRAVERIGLSSRLVPVDPVPRDGPTPTWEAAVRDALKQILEDPAAAVLLAGGAGSPGEGLP